MDATHNSEYKIGKIYGTTNNNNKHQCWLEGSIFDFATDNQDDILIEGDKALIRGIGISKHVTKRTGGSGYTRGISWYYND